VPVFGCARRLREEAGAPVPAPEHRTVAADRARITAVLDPERLAAELAAGAAAGLQAILD
jgi:hypothetical protein